MDAKNGLGRKEDWFSGTVLPRHGEKIAVVHGKGGAVSEQEKAGRG